MRFHLSVILQFSAYHYPKPRSPYGRLLASPTWTQRSQSSSYVVCVKATPREAGVRRRYFRSEYIARQSQTVSTTSAANKSKDIVKRYAPIRKRWGSSFGTIRKFPKRPFSSTYPCEQDRVSRSKRLSMVMPKHRSWCGGISSWYQQPRLKDMMRKQGPVEEDDFVLPQNLVVGTRRVFHHLV
jgi:hypothetical protein